MQWGDFTGNQVELSWCSVYLGLCVECAHELKSVVSLDSTAKLAKFQDGVYKAVVTGVLVFLHCVKLRHFDCLDVVYSLMQPVARIYIQSSDSGISHPHIFFFFQ